MSQGVKILDFPPDFLFVVVVRAFDRYRFMK